MKIEELEVSVRVFNALSRAGYTKVGELEDTPVQVLLKVPNLGKSAITELRNLGVKIPQWVYTPYGYQHECPRCHRVAYYQRDFSAKCKPCNRTMVLSWS